MGADVHPKELPNPSKPLESQVPGLPVLPVCTEMSAQIKTHRNGNGKFCLSRICWIYPSQGAGTSLCSLILFSMRLGRVGKGRMGRTKGILYLVRMQLCTNYFYVPSSSFSISCCEKLQNFPVIHIHAKGCSKLCPRTGRTAWSCVPEAQPQP